MPEKIENCDFDFFESIEKHIEQLAAPPEVIPKSKILARLINQFEPLDFAAKLYPNLPDGERVGKKIKTDELKVLVIDEILSAATLNNWSMCKRSGFCYLYNGQFWEVLDEEDIQHFISDCALKLGVKEVMAKDCKIVAEMYKQFHFSAFIQPPEFDNDKVLINLQNGTFELSTQKQELRPFSQHDFLTYQLPFAYDGLATAPIFKKYLDRVLPDKTAQAVLAEYAGYLFIRHGAGFKFEKCLVLYGSGANGKSVFYEVLLALLGRENVSTYSLNDLTDKTGYYRAQITNKLLNYASEIGGSANTDLFKELASGEQFTARSPYGKPFTVSNYAKMIFNANTLPKNAEHTRAYFRRYIIIPFDVTIPENEMDRELHRKIINNELAGVFVWVLDGLKRLLSNKKFTDCVAAENILKQYQLESDSVQMFLEENGYEPSEKTRQTLGSLHRQYRDFCNIDGYTACGKKTFAERLKAQQFRIYKSGDKYVQMNKNYVPNGFETETEIEREDWE